MKQKHREILVIMSVIVVACVGGVLVFRGYLEMMWLRIGAMGIGDSERFMMFLDREARGVQIKHLMYGVENYEDLRWYDPLREMVVVNGVAEMILGYRGDKESLRVLERTYRKLGERIRRGYYGRGSRGERDCLGVIAHVISGLALSRNYDQGRLYDLVMGEKDERVFRMAAVGAIMSWDEYGGIETKKLVEGLRKEVVRRRRKKRENGQEGSGGN